MKVSLSLQLPKLDIDAYRQAVTDRLTEAVQNAAREWLGAVTALVPVWSGAAKATFRHLANAVNFALPISPAPTSRKGLGEGAGEAASTGGLRIDGAQFLFEYTTDLAHLIENELGTTPAGIARKLKVKPPYSFQEAGSRAFEEFAKTVRLPNPNDFVRLTTVEV